MSSRINQLLQAWPAGGVATQRWLAQQDVDARLADKYARSGWLERLGHGAYMRTGTSPDWPGGVNALQTQLDLDVHPGAMTALAIRGYAQNIPLSGRETVLFGGVGTQLPLWFQGRWSRSVTLITTSVFPEDAYATSPLTVDNVELAVATLEQAALEMMYLVPKRQAWEEAVQTMEMLTSLRPSVVQEMLEGCRSVKVKRLFMHAAERFEHSWLAGLDLTRVYFGSGRRTIHAGGRLDKKYDLVVADPGHA